MIARAALRNVCKILLYFPTWKNLMLKDQKDTVLKTRYVKDELERLLQIKYLVSKGKNVEKGGEAKGKIKNDEKEKQQHKPGDKTRYVKDELERLVQIKYLVSKGKNIEKGGEEKGKIKNDEKQQHKAGDKFQIKPPKGTRDFYPHQMAIRRKVIDDVVKVFKKHGAVQIDTPIFQLKEVLTGKYGEDSKLIYDLQDQGGQLCSLRYDLTVPFARFMANNTNIQKIKRFHIGKVYRRDQPTINKGRYREFYQCDFDIAGKYDSMIPDSEVIGIMQEILETLGVDEFLVKVNHRKLLEAMIKEAGCKVEHFKTICSSLDKLDKEPWGKVKEELVNIKGIPEDCANILGNLTTYRGNPLLLLQQLIGKNVFEKTAKEVEPILQEMRKLFSYLQSMDRLKKVSFDLSLARGLDYYTGVIYEIVLTDKKTELGSISGGGRYDDLIGMFSQHQIPSVGGSIGIQRIFTILQQKYKNKVKQNCCEVLVAAIGKIRVEDKFKILSELWKADINAETLYVEKSKPDRQIKHAFSNGIPMILWIGQDELISGNLKLKILYQHKQVLVNMKNLANEVKEHVLLFRSDFQKGMVNLQDPQKKKTE